MKNYLTKEKYDFRQLKKRIWGHQTKKLKVITNPIREIKGRNFLLLLNIKSKTTIATNVKAKDISGKIARRSVVKFGKVNVITL